MRERGRVKTRVLVFLIFLDTLCSRLVRGGKFNPCQFWQSSRYAGNGFCYKFTTAHVTFSEAQLACYERDGGVLAEPRTWQQWLTAQQMTLTVPVWLGATTANSSLNWVKDGQAVDVPGSWWTQQLVVSGSQSVTSCLVLGKDSLLVLQGCGMDIYSEGYLCQRESQNPCDIFLPGAEFNQNSCFLALAQNVTISTAKDQCERRNALLLETQSEKELNFARLIKYDKLHEDASVWLGLSPSTLPGETSFTWLSSSSSAGITFWGQGQPDMTSLTSDNDAAVVLSNWPEWSWKVTSTSSLAQVICEMDLTDKCDGVFISDSCFTLHPDLVTARKAATFCENNDTSLAELPTDVISKAINSYLLLEQVQNDVFLGATNQNSVSVGVSEFRWLYSGHLLTETHTNWAVNQPSLDSLKPYVVWSPDTQQWKNVGSFLPGKFVCEQKYHDYSEMDWEYMVVVPDTGWSDVTSTSLVSVSSQLQHRPTRVYFQLTILSTGVEREHSVFDTETLQFPLNSSVLSSNCQAGSGVQKKGILIRATDHLQVILHIWRNDLTAVVSSLVFPVFTRDASRTFFSFSGGNERVKLDVVSTGTSDASLEVSLSGEVKFDGLTVRTVPASQGATMALTSTFREQYQTISIPSGTGGETPTFIHSNQSILVFSVSIQEPPVGTDMTFDPILSISLVGTEYVTYPSLPMSSDVIDRYTVVSINSNTEITIHKTDLVSGSETFTLSKPGDTSVLDLPADAFYYVNGSKPFYMFGRLGFSSGHTAKEAQSSAGGLCRLSLLQNDLLSVSYKFDFQGPLLKMQDVYILVVIPAKLSGEIYLTSVEDSTVLRPEECLEVTASVSDKDSPSKTSFVLRDYGPSRKFGAIVFARSPGVATCYNLGVNRYFQTDTVPQEFDATGYLASLDTAHVYPEVLTTSLPDESTVSDSEQTTEVSTSEQTTTEYFPTSTTTVEDEATTERGLEPNNSTIRETLATFNCSRLQQEVSLRMSNISLRMTNISLTLDFAVAHISQALRINTTELSSSRRRKMSEPDDRLTSASLGLTSVFLALAFLSVFTLTDLVMFVRAIWRRLFCPGPRHHHHRGGNI